MVSLLSLMCSRRPIVRPTRRRARKPARTSCLGSPRSRGCVHSLQAAPQPSTSSSCELSVRLQSYLSTSYSKAAEAARSSWASHRLSAGGGPHSPHQAAPDQDCLSQRPGHFAKHASSMVKRMLLATSLPHQLHAKMRHATSLEVDRQLVDLLGHEHFKAFLLGPSAYLLISLACKMFLLPSLSKVRSPSLMAW